MRSHFLQSRPSCHRPRSGPLGPAVPPRPTRLLVDPKERLRAPVLLPNPCPGSHHNRMDLFLARRLTGTARQPMQLPGPRLDDLTGPGRRELCLVLLGRLYGLALPPEAPPHPRPTPSWSICQISQDPSRMSLLSPNGSNLTLQHLRPPHRHLQMGFGRWFPQGP